MGPNPVYADNSRIPVQDRSHHGPTVIPNPEDWSTPRHWYANTNMLAQLPAALTNDGKTDILLAIAVADDVVQNEKNKVRVDLHLLLSDADAQDLPNDERLAQRLLDLGTRQLVVTRGKKGAILATAEDVEYIPAVSDIAAVDVTGAGDSFNAALAVGLGEGLDLRQAAIWASRAGAYTVQHLGVINGLPTRAELSEFTEKTGG